MLITALEKTPKTIPDMAGAEGVFKQVPISREAGTPNFSFRVFTLKPGGHTPLHRHPFEHLNYIIEGSGVIDTGDQELAIRKGDFAMILPGETHQFRNTSDGQPLVLICAVPKENE